jgi:hypothetical protein
MLRKVSAALVASFVLPTRTKLLWMFALALSAAGLRPGAASADFIVMTDINTANANVAGTAGGTAIYSISSAGSGTGIFPAFVQVQHNGTESGYNTTVNNVLNNGSDATHNHEIQAGNISVAVIGGKQYFQFNLDINESHGGTSGGTAADAYISLDSLKIYTSSTPNQSVTDPDLLGTKQYDQGDHTILLNYGNFSGSGKSDLVVFIPVWAGVNPSDYVYLYSAFGGAGVLAAGAGTGTLSAAGTYGSPAGDYGTSDGFEEWSNSLGGASLSAPAPSGTALALCGIGFVGVWQFVRRKPARPAIA